MSRVDVLWRWVGFDASEASVTALRAMDSERPSFVWIDFPRNYQHYWGLELAERYSKARFGYLVRVCIPVRVQHRRSGGAMVQFRSGNDYAASGTNANWVS